MNFPLKESYLLCSNIAKSKAKNFYYGFILLPKTKRMAISAVYAFMRICDDIVDEHDAVILTNEKQNMNNYLSQKSFVSHSAGQHKYIHTNERPSKTQKLNQWKEKVQKLLNNQDLSHPIFPALHDTIQKFKIPHRYFLEAIEGVEMDLASRRFEKFEDLKPYCYKVASVVGLICLYIFGFKNQDALVHAEACGIAFQLTNILRDIKEDIEMGRVYIPQEDLKKFGYSEEDLKKYVYSPVFQKLMQFEVERAKSFYVEAFKLPALIDKDSRKSLQVMIKIYHGLLKKICKSNYNIFSERVHLSLFEKIKILISPSLS